MQRRRSATASTLPLCAATNMLLLTAGTPQASQEPVSSTPQGTDSTVCSAVVNLYSSLEEFRSTVTPEVTVEELRIARDKAKVAQDAVATEIQDLARDQLMELNAEIDRFQAAIEDVADSATVRDATVALGNETEAVDTPLNDLASKLRR